MTTMFDAPMHDFSGDNTMDADMLPPSNSDTDWLQVENMMEDGDVPRPLAEEVDMTHGDVQEFEMRDAGETDYTEAHIQTPEASGLHLRAEPQDQYIPDASRAPSPSVQPSFLQTELHSTSIVSKEPLQESHSEEGSSQEVTRGVSSDPTTFPKDNEGVVESLVQHPEPSTEQVSIPLVEGDGTVIDTRNISVTSASLLDPPEQGDAPQPFSDHAVHTDPSQEDHSLPEDKEDGCSHTETAPQSEGHVENQVTQDEEEEGPVIDPPPAVLLSYPFDGSHFSLFNFPEEPQHDHVVTGIGVRSMGHDQRTHEPDDKQITSGTESLTVSDAPILLFRERFALYYEPLARVFEALRGEESVNTGGRFDPNIELVISAVELDLTLPEDNVNAREVSLHDLGVLHTGCDLSGPLSLRLDTISPRFGTRYRAIRDEIVRVVSQQEEDERQDELESTEALYTDVLQDKHVPHEALEDHSLISNHHPDVVDHSNDGHEQTSECKTDEGQNENHEQVSNAHLVEAEQNVQEDVEADAEGDDDVEGYEDVESGEYVAYEQYDDSRDDAAEGTYEGGEGEYAGEEREGEEVGYEDAEASYTLESGENQADDLDETQALPDETVQSRSLLPDDANDSEATGEALEHTVQSEDQGPFAADPSDDELASSTMFAPVQELTDTHASTSTAVVNHLVDTPELDHSVHEVTSNDFLLSAEPYSDAEPLLSGVRHHSRSDTSQLSTSVKIGDDEVIAYEDTVEDDDESDELSKEPKLPATFGIQGPHAVSTATKRSYDEHEFDELEREDAQHGATSESKRLRAA